MAINQTYVAEDAFPRYFSMATGSLCALEMSWSREMPSCFFSSSFAGLEERDQNHQELELFDCKLIIIHFWFIRSMLLPPVSGFPPAVSSDFPRFSSVESLPISSPSRRSELIYFSESLLYFCVTGSGSFLSLCLSISESDRAPSAMRSASSLERGVESFTAEGEGEGDELREEEQLSLSESFTWTRTTTESGLWKGYEVLTSSNFVSHELQFSNQGNSSFVH